MRRLVAGVCLGLAAAAAGAADWGLAPLFAQLAKDRPGRATFHERKFMALLDRPLESTGELAFTPPDTMEKRTLTPRAEVVRVDRERVTLERGGRKQSLELRANPAVAVLVDGVRATLAGDLDALTRAYSAGLDGTPERWRLVLRPLDSEAARLVERIEISGSGARVNKVEILQADGDRSVMSITQAAP